MCKTLIVQYETPDQEKVEFGLEHVLFHFHFIDFKGMQQN